MTERNTLIYDGNEIKKFLSLFPPLEKDELYMATLFSRNKTISAEDRIALGLPRAHTLAFAVSDNAEDFIKKIYRWETNPKAFLTKTGVPQPNEALVPYISVYPVSPIKAYPEFNRIMTEYLIELSAGGDRKNTFNRIKKTDRLMLECMHHAFSRKIFIDIDFDIPTKDWKGFGYFEDELTKRGVKFSIVETNGGFHYLLHKETLNYNFNLDIEYLRKCATTETWGKDKWEIEVRKRFVDFFIIS
jgi:hypothetical protein